MIFEPISYKKTGVNSYKDYPLGTVILSANQDVDSEWLRCDGRYINQTDYPALVEYLGKTIPDAEEATKFGGEGYNGSFSTSYNYNGYVWTYWFDEHVLLGFPIGAGEEKRISVTGEFDFLESEETPVILSICGTRVFLCQTAVDLAYIHVYSGEFSDSSSITMSKIETEEKLKANKVYGASNNYKREYKIYVPEVVYIENYTYNNTKQNCYLMLAFSAMQYIYTYNNNESLSNGFSYFALVIPESDINSCSFEQIYYYTHSGYADRYSPYICSLLRFSRKTENELFLISGYNNTNNNSSYSNVTMSCKSLVSGLYTSMDNKNLYMNYQYLYKDPIQTSPIVGNDIFIYRAYIKDNEVYIRAGNVYPFNTFDNTADGSKLNNIKLSSYSQVFPDSMEYIASHDMFVIFVGTGICFSHTPLDMNSWGYFDTTEYFGIITYLGNAEFDMETNTLCISGRNTENNFVCGKIKLHERFDYANDGAWLPYIASNGVPAWIKSTEVKEPNNTLKIYVYSNRKFDNYYALYLNGDRLAGSGNTSNYINYTKIISGSTFTIKVEKLNETTEYGAKISVKEANIITMPSNIPVGESIELTLPLNDYASIGTNSSMTIRCLV